MNTFALHRGDSLVVLPTLPENSIDSIVTDTPYGLEFMGKNWDKGVPGPQFWVESLRVAKPGAYLLAFGGSRTFHRLVCNIEDAGWEVRDVMMWLYGSGFPKSHNMSTMMDDPGEWDGWGTALKPAYEPILVARKPLAGTIIQNVQAHGTGVMNIDACRVGVNPNDDIFAKNPHTKGGFGHGEASIYGTSDGADAYDPSKGRWPANILHDGSDEVVSAFPGEEARFFYCAKASRQDRDEGLENFVTATAGQITGGRKEGSAGLKSPRAGAGRNSGGKNVHPTVKPTELMRWCVRLVTRKGGTVLDLFCGSGSTGKAAILEGCNFIGIDIDEDNTYLPISRARIEWAQRQVEEQIPTLG